MRQPNAHNDAAKTAQAALDQQIQRIERLSGFGLELATALRGEFHYYWGHPERCKAVPEAVKLVERVEVLATLAAHQQREAARCRQATAAQAAGVLKALDPTALFEAGRGLEAMARVLRPLGRERGWGMHRVDASAPIAASLRAAAEAEGFAWTIDEDASPLTAGAKGLAGKLLGWLGRLEVTALGGERRDAPPTQPSIGGRRLAAFESALDLVVDVVTEMGPRLKAVRLALDACDAHSIAGLEAAGKAARLPGELVASLTPLAEVLMAQDAARSEARIAVTNWADANRQLPAFIRARDAARAGPPEAVAGVLRPHDLGRLKGLVLPLTNLHLTFRGLPVLAGLFPAPDTRRLAVPAVERPEGATTALAGARAATQALASPGTRSPTQPLTLPGTGSQGPTESLTPEGRQRVPTRTAPLDWRIGAEEASKRRLATIMGHLAEPTRDLTLRDPKVLYRIVSEEHTYQHERGLDLGIQLRLLPAPRRDEPAERKAQRETFQQGLAESRQLQAQLQELLTRVAQGRPLG